jgi:hypothetical protein
MNIRNPLVQILLGASTLLAGCDGAVITVEPNQTTCENPKPAACYLVKSNQGVWLYDTLKGCDTIPANSQLSNEGACGNEGAEVDICDSPEPPPGAPACYAVSPNLAECPLGNCEVEYRVANFCGVRGEIAEIVDPGYCDGTLPIVSACAQLDGRTYYSTTLEEGGHTPAGVGKSHWQISFNAGQLSLLQSDFALSGTYACDGNQVIATIDSGIKEEKILALSEDLSQLIVDPLGSGERTYLYSDKSYDSFSCEAVQGHRYSTPDSSPLEHSVFLAFESAINTLTYGHDGISESAYYDCQLGELHLHLDSDTSHPLVVSVEQGGTVVVIQDEAKLALTRTDLAGVCTQQYEPVCAGYDTGIRCITTPCPSLVYKTYGNRCSAEADNSVVLFEGECGKLEDQPVEALPVVCPAIYAPVCAKDASNIVCITSPCESHLYKTFGNSCEANAELAAITFQGGCEILGLEGQLSFAQAPVRLFNLGADRQTLPESEGISVIGATVDNDVLSVTLGFSGCSVQPIHFNVDASVVLESAPVQLRYSFNKETDDDCDAYFESTFNYDLIPIKKNFSEHGAIGIALFGAAGVVYKF